MLSILKLVSILLLCNFGADAYSNYNNYKKVRLTDIDVLTFKSGAMTTGRRSSPVNQMQCVGGSARFDSSKVSNIQCKNAGFDGNDVNWKCETVISDHYKLGRIEVSCEGFDYPEDPYILVGSCGIEYELEYTDKYYESLKPKTPTVKTHTVIREPRVVVENTHYKYQHPHSNESEGNIFLVILAFLMFCFLICFLCRCDDNVNYTETSRLRGERSPTRSSNSYQSTRYETTTTTRQRNKDSKNNNSKKDKPEVVEKRVVEKHVIERPIVVEKRVVVDRPVVIDRSVVIDRPVVVDRRPVVVESPPSVTVVDHRETNSSSDSTTPVERKTEGFGTTKRR